VRLLLEYLGARKVAKKLSKVKPLRATCNPRSNVERIECLNCEQEGKRAIALRLNY